MSNAPDAPVESADAAPESAAPLINKVMKGQRDPAALSAERRRAIVGHIMLDGVTASEAATILRCSERTIERACRALREADALEIDPKLTRELAGELLKKAQYTVMRLRRLGRNKDLPATVRILAEERAFHVLRDVLTTLVGVGLPAADELGAATTARMVELVRHHDVATSAWAAVRPAPQRRAFEP